MFDMEISGAMPGSFISDENELNAGWMMSNNEAINDGTLEWSSQRAGW